MTRTIARQVASITAVPNASHVYVVSFREHLFEWDSYHYTQHNPPAKLGHHGLAATECNHRIVLDTSSQRQTVSIVADPFANALDGTQGHFLWTTPFGELERNNITLELRLLRAPSFPGCAGLVLTDEDGRQTYTRMRVLPTERMAWNPHVHTEGAILMLSFKQDSGASCKMVDVHWSIPQQSLFHRHSSMLVPLGVPLRPSARHWRWWVALRAGESARILNRD